MTAVGHEQTNRPHQCRVCLCAVNRLPSMTIQGLGKVDIPNEQEQLALSVLADKIRFAAHESLDLWTQAYEAGKKAA